MSDNKITFGKVFWPSFLAVLIMSIIGLLIFFLILGGIIGSFGEFGPKPLAVKDKTVLHMTLDGQIGEKGENSFDASSFSLNKTIGLSDILYGIEKAKTDTKIKGIFIEIGDLNCGFATAREIRNAINDFEKSGKFAVAYNRGEMISQKEYYVASAADENYGFPSSNMEFVGLGAELSFFKGTLAKLDVEVEIIRGSNNDFKSAVEPFFRDNMSDSSRVQIERYLNSMWLDIREEIAKDRNVSATTLNEIAEDAKIHRAQDAVDYKLLDGVMYRDEVMELVSKKAGTDNADGIELQAFEKYATKKFNQDQAKAKNNKPNIAVILAEGGVAVDGDGLTSKEICKLFQDVRKNTSIKTVVFRINSPGGSALASDEIWREVKLTNKVKKVIVSMGDVAASGGYYIAAPATYIFAEPTTITGSIGVFGMIPYTGKMFENKLGMTFDRATTNQHSVLSTNRKLTPAELAIIQEEVDNIYDEFLGRVAEGRKMTKEQVNVIARGRVWTGRDALKIGLVDKLGGIKDAINYAAKEYGIKDQKVLYYPIRKDQKWMEILEQIEEEEENASIKIESAELPKELVEQYKKLKKIESYSGMQMRLPFELDIR
ncbi:MAG: signal peptide peptidase SppA [Crocinitomicaceae bacterium]|jgi:protease IV|nr:signal peptide peptidase SppA [Crocinitomicaceae bacterium]MDP4865968.1 signal peptide peptidase SppA [Crocinitomicaceae bacterium]MDP5010948.1 signal peptide peptidase SppA [Crocinitomicaceae bacterium]MDP5098514.1 signal peptide peptidase SppA [Crocinitomicaceae bacterium]